MADSARTGPTPRPATAFLLVTTLIQLENF